MSISAQEITIAVTVFNRRQFLEEAIGSALNQTTPVRVIVVEDCGPEPDLKKFVLDRFGSQVDYFRNPFRRGLFDNWNACMEYCRTPWLSILHDDDFVSPRFIESILELSQAAPGCGLYYGLTGLVDHRGQPLPGHETKAIAAAWKRADLAEAIDNTPFPFPGHIFRVDFARQLGGFRTSSQFTGDWEMWVRLIANFKGAQTNLITGYQRSHAGPERGTTKVFLNGRMWPLVTVQQKRVLHLLRQRGAAVKFDRGEFLKKSPMPASFLLRHGAQLTPRMLRYCVECMVRSHAPSIGYGIFQLGARIFGVPFVRTTSNLFRARTSRPAQGLAVTTSPKPEAAQKSTQK